MTDPTNAGLPALTELRDRHRAFVRKMAPILEQLRPLVEERRQLMALTRRLYSLEEAKVDRLTWIKTGENAYIERSGLAESGDALATLANLADEMERADLPPDDGEPENRATDRGSVSRPWTPEMPEDLERGLAEQRIADLDDEVANLREGVMIAAKAVEGMFHNFCGIYGNEYGEEGHEELIRSIGGAWVRAGIMAHEAREHLRHQLEERRS